MKSNSKTVKLSRRTLLKGMSAAVASAALSGCGSSNDDSAYVSPQEQLVFDRETKTCFSSGGFNCGSRCVYKIHYKNGRLLKMTSAGDISRVDSKNADETSGEFGMPMQQRACARGYSTIQRVYQPDRLLEEY